MIDGVGEGLVPEAVGVVVELTDEPRLVVGVTLAVIDRVEVAEFVAEELIDGAPHEAVKVNDPVAPLKPSTTTKYVPGFKVTVKRLVAPQPPASSLKPNLNCRSVLNT